MIFPAADRVMDTSISKYWKLIPKMNKWSKSEIKQWQDERFKILVEDAYANTRYYRNLMDSMGIIPSDVSHTEDVKLFPALTKDIIKTNYLDMLSKNSANIKHKECRTGGSTGDPLTYIQSHKAWSYVSADNIVNFEKTDYRYGDAFVALGSTSIMIDKPQSWKHKIYYKLKNKHGLSGINLTDEILSQYLDYFDKKKIYYIYGYASSIYLLARYAIKTGWNGKIKGCL